MQAFKLGVSIAYFKEIICINHFCPLFIQTDSAIVLSVKNKTSHLYSYYTTVHAVLV